jgi:DNA recombination protein RmuC
MVKSFVLCSDVPVNRKFRSMNDVVLILGSYPLTLGKLVIGMAAASMGLLTIVTVLLFRTRRERAL